MRNKRTLLIVIPILILVTVLFAMLDRIGASDRVIISGVSGEWDLRGMTFDGGERYRLPGPVEFIPGALLTPEEFAAREGEARLGSNTDATSDSRYGTTRIRVLLPDDGYYSFSCRSLDFSQRTFVNGLLVSQVGSPGETAETAVPNTAMIYLTLKPADGVVEIVTQTANFVHREGGVHGTWTVGGPGMTRELSRSFYTSIMLGCFLALFIIHIILFILMRSYKANLYFALFCLMWFMRTGAMTNLIFSDIFPWMPWTLKFRMEYMTLPVTAVLMVSLLDALFPGIPQKWFRYAVYGVSAVFAVIFLLAGTVFMSGVIVFCYAAYLPAIIYIAARFAMKYRSVNMEQCVFLAGLGLFFFLTAHDMLWHIGIRIIPTISPNSATAMLILTFYQAAAVFIGTVKTVEQAIAEKTVLTEAARHTETVLDMQREQYERQLRDSENIKKIRHDMRHHLTVISGYSHSGDKEKLGEYMARLADAIPAFDEKYYCENYAANAVAAHYLSTAENEGITVDVRLVVPEETGKIPAMDLCVIMGNLLENAVEACRRMEQGRRHIRVRSRAEGGMLYIVVENSFDGLWREANGAYLSRKEAEAGREGVGLASVRAVCEKHGGFAQFEINGTIWTSSAIVKMEN